MSAVAIGQDPRQYDDLEHAVRGTKHGRAFLEEFALRLRSSDTDRILSAIGDLRARLTDNVTTSNLEVLRRELESMAASIAQTRREIAAMRPDGPGHNRIVTATEELDFVVRSTEQATSEILGAAERIQQIATQLRSKEPAERLCDELEMHGTNLMVACSFQDLTGQRMTKVVQTLRYLETRVNAMIKIWGITPEDAAEVAGTGASDRPDGHLLNGPPRDGEGVGQDDIDRLMRDEAASHDGPPATAAASQDDIDILFR